MKFRRNCTGNSSARVPTYLTSRVALRYISCWTPRLHVSTLGKTVLLGRCALVRFRAAAGSAGGIETGGRPPPAKKPVPVEHHEGIGVKVQADDEFSSLCSCGGKEIESKFWNFTS